MDYYEKYLMHAIKNANVEMVKLLLKSGANTKFKTCAIIEEQLDKPTVTNINEVIEAYKAYHQDGKPLKYTFSLPKDKSKLDALNEIYKLVKFRSL